MLKTSAYGLGFQHLPRDLANANAWKTMFDPYRNKVHFERDEIILEVYKLNTILDSMSFHLKFMKVAEGLFHKLHMKWTLV